MLRSKKVAERGVQVASVDDYSLCTPRHCDYQFAPNWVFGIEGDGEAADVKGDATATVFGITEPPTPEQTGLLA